MNWSNVRLIWIRELRDQLRDRRTIFTIAVLPLLLYPLLGMSILQITQFTRETPSRIWILGAGGLPENPKLLNSSSSNFSDELVVSGTAQLLQLHVDSNVPTPTENGGIAHLAETHIRRGTYDAVVYFPQDFGDQLDSFRQSLRANSAETASQPVDEHPDSSLSNEVGEVKLAAVGLPEPQLFVDTANDKSRIAATRLENVLRAWRDRIVQDSLRSSRIPINVTTPFQVSSKDVAKEVRRKAAVWSKILPFIVLIWALTGAFYPAVDLCAGEKERGTLETLLSSPAARQEIVWGKLLTTMCLSIGTAVLNLLSMGITGVFISGQMQRLSESSVGLGLGQPPWGAIGWLIVAVVPISALFSALSLAIAAFARSSKEGQYYLMPLLLIALPLMLLPILPATELTLGTSLIPVTGAMLLLRSLIEGQFLIALRFMLPAAGVTVICSLLAIRWAVDQFSNESVLFRETERFDLVLWLRSLVNHRPETPYVSSAVLCGVILLITHFVVSLVAQPPQDWWGFAGLTAMNLAVSIAMPAVLMATFLSRNPRQTLLLHFPYPMALPAAMLLAISLHPIGMEVTQFIAWLYPLGTEVTAQLQSIEKLLAGAPHLLWILALIAIVPAICEELAFRGFILSGLRRSGDTWLAVIVSSVFFGATHGLLQQSLSATLLGLVLGFVAVRSGSLYPCMLFHFTYNALGVLLGISANSLAELSGWVNWLLITDSVSGVRYHPVVVLLGTACSMFLCGWFYNLGTRASVAIPSESATDANLEFLIRRPSDVLAKRASVEGNVTA